MHQLPLLAAANRPLRSLVEAALTNELHLLAATIKRTEERLRTFENAHDMSSADFLVCYEGDELPETLDFTDWIGEYRLLNRRHEKTDGG